MPFIIATCLLIKELLEKYLPDTEQTPSGNKPPRVWHAVLTEAETKGKRVIIIGDIHGCLHELKALLQKCGWQRGKDLVVLVGDLVNKGPYSAEVLGFARDEGIYSVQGNHDDAALTAYGHWRAGRPDGWHITKAAKVGWVPGLAPSLARWLGSLPFTLSLPEHGVLVVHAGLVPGRPLERQAIADMLKMRDVIPAVLQSPAKAPPAAAAELAPSESEYESEEAGEGGRGSNGGRGSGNGSSSAFDWQAALLAYAQLAQPGTGSQGRGSTHSMRSGSNGGAAQRRGSSSGNGGAGAGGSRGSSLRVDVPQRGQEVGPEWQLSGAEHPSPQGKPWAAVWRGPQHVLFGHDAKRRLQLERFATGLDSGCVYGGQLTAAILPPLGPNGEQVLEQTGVPEDAREIQLSTGRKAFLVSVPAAKMYSHKFDRTLTNASRSHVPQIR